MEVSQTQIQHLSESIKSKVRSQVTHPCRHCPREHQLFYLEGLAGMSLNYYHTFGKFNEKRVLVAVPFEEGLPIETTLSKAVLKMKSNTGQSEQGSLLTP